MKVKRKKAKLDIILVMYVCMYVYIDKLIVIRKEIKKS